MHMNALRRVRQAAARGTGLALVGLMGSVSVLALPLSATAAELTAESTSLSDPTISHAATTYTVTQSSVSLSAIKCLQVVFSVNADGTGGVPTGMSTTSATFNGSSTYVPTPASWSVDATTNGTVNITFATGETPASASGRTIVLGSITNGSTANTTYYTTVQTFNNTDCSTSPVDDGGQSTYVFVDGVVVTATVNPTLTFTVDSTTCNLGTLTSSSTGNCSHTITAASNATSGYVISYIASPTLTSGGNTITANGASAVANATNTEQFGLNLVANSSPSVGANPSGGTGAAAANYNTANSFAFTTAGATVATTAGPSALTTYTVSYIANIDAVTEAGLYTKTQTYTITATY